MEKSEAIRPVILVYPNGFRNGYMDHHDGKIMIESLMINELIPLIDAKYRAIASREGRAVHGFSMGSSGALRFVIKYPDLFCAAVAYGVGAIDLATTKSQFVLDILQRNLKSDPDLIRQHNTYHFLEKNHEIVRKNGIRIRLICGTDDSWKESAVTFQRALQEKRVPCVVSSVGTRLGQLIASRTACPFQCLLARYSPSFADFGYANRLATAAHRLRHEVIGLSTPPRFERRDRAIPECGRRVALGPASREPFGP